MPRRVMIIAGEASGDLHGSGVVRELRQRIPSLDVYGIGGDAMKREGADIVHHISELSFMGFLEVVKNLPTVFRVEDSMRHFLEERRPDVVVLIDYPGFNLRFARSVKKAGIPVVYYISPQVWAWHKGRVKAMRRLVDRMKVVLPFEVPFYQREGIDVEFVGHPIVERIGASRSREEFFSFHGLDKSKKLLGLFPGSRVQEIEHILPAMMATAGELRRTTGAQVALGVAPNLGLSALAPYLYGSPWAVPVQFGTYDLMQHADAAIVTSGTATLETGWFGTPMAVVYRTSPVTFFIGRLLVDVPAIGLVNIVAGRKIVPEFIQHEMTVPNLVEAVGPLLTDAKKNMAMRNDLSVIKTLLGGPGASRRVADEIIRLGGDA